MDTGHVKFPLADDPEMQAIDKRRELLAAHRAVAKHVAWIIHVRKQQGIVETSISLSTVARFLAAEIEQLEQAE